MSYLTKSEVASHYSGIKDEFDRLMSNRLLVSKIQAKQWRFFQHCLNCLVTGIGEDFPCSNAKATNYKFEVSRTLKAYYAKPKRKASNYAFRLEHISHQQPFITQNPDYPVTNQYLLLISPTRRKSIGTEALNNILFRTVDDAIHAEFDAYRRLPAIELALLEDCFDKAGPAYKQVRETIERHHRNNEVITNQGNSSTRQLKSLRVIKVEDNGATVRTVEYWYLEWWSQSYMAYSPELYKGTNRQEYVLVRQNDRWLVWSNSFRPPRARQ